ncbi:polysaccharide lyase family 8 protein [Rhizoctonia solani AG-1 IA]|uniref:Polysaccharide lyase family 8 protein n=1 Tax=Thanatephorus cucumeris (strain AG1-IA) TaxID=983506 RepID=L8X3M4_THACA|nr:polysaccharide lyase family 8 protein [Rhizoctonia solani AG-1 IA]
MRIAGNYQSRGCRWVRPALLTSHIYSEEKDWFTSRTAAPAFVMTTQFASIVNLSSSHLAQVLELSPTELNGPRPEQLLISQLNQSSQELANFNCDSFVPFDQQPSGLPGTAHNSYLMVWLSKNAVTLQLAGAIFSSLAYANDLETIYNRQTELIISTTIDTLKPDGTWSAIDYTSGCTARRSSWPASGHWSRLLEMTVAYRGGLPRYKNNAHLRSAIHRAMGYWFDHDYSTIGDGSCMDREQLPAHHCPCGTPGLWGPNWYSNVILIPTRVGKVCILLRQELSDTELAKCTTMTARAYAPFYRDPKPGYLSGANVMDIAVIGIMAALLENDRSGNATRIADAYGRVHSQTLVQSEDRVDGIKPDGSFQHSSCNYRELRERFVRASAHVILLALKVGCSSNSFIQLSLLALGTQFQAKKEVQQSFGRWFEGARWMTYTNVMNNVVHWDLVRAIFASTNLMLTLITVRHRSFHIVSCGRWKVRNLAFDLYASYDVPRASADLRMDLSQILKLGKAWSQRDLIEFGTRLTGSADNSANSGGLVGSRMFWNSDYMVSWRAEYEDIFAGLDYSIPPGITTDYAATKLECATATRAGADSYAGGVEADDVAMAAMRYLNPLSQSFGFYKAWFFFPNNVQHVLVANVQQYSQHSHPAFSVLDQRLRSGDVYLNGQPISEGGNFTETNTLWHGGTGYTFPPDQAISTPVSVCLQSKSGDWSKIGTSKRPPSIKDIFTAWLVHTPSSRIPTTHSSDPNTSAPIEYSVFPATRSNSEFENKARRDGFTCYGAGSGVLETFGWECIGQGDGSWAGGGSRSGGDAQVQGRGAYQGQDLCCGPDTWFWDGYCQGQLAWSGYLAALCRRGVFWE